LSAVPSVLPIEALLFDLDGTLVDSMPIHHAAWRQWFARHALPFDDAGFFAATAGRTNDEILRELLPALDAAARLALAEEKEALYRAEAARSLHLVAGADAVLTLARDAGLRLAICTAAPPGNMRVAFDRFALDRRVDAITSPADAAFGGRPGESLRGKPHPDIFLEAARRLGVAPQACVVFEDAPLGIEAARRAGMRAVALTTTLPAAAFAEYDNLQHTMPDFIGFDLRCLTPRTRQHA
jgi:beta-phosphoglucomutase-like phosphatase (HAD superfamily)